MGYELEIARLQTLLQPKKEEINQASLEVVRISHNVATIHQQREIILPLARAAGEQRGEQKHRRLRDMNNPYDQYQQLWRDLQNAIEESSEALATYKRLCREYKLIFNQIAWLEYVEKNPEWWKTSEPVTQPTQMSIVELLPESALGSA